MNRFFVTASLTAVSLFVVLGAGGSLGVDATSWRAASTSDAGAAGESVWPQPAPKPAVRQAALRARPPARTPRPIRGDGYRVVFKDTFENLRRSVWCSHQWWEPNPQPGTQYVEDGVLHLVRRRSDGYLDVTVSSEPCGQANPKSFRYGYMEARIRYNKARGNGPAFWLLSTRHQRHATSPGWNPNTPNPICARRGEPITHCFASELDIFEGFGNIQYGGSRTDDFFSGALHRNTGEFYGQPNRFRFVQRGTGLDLSRWHTYAARWTQSTVSYYIDGRRQGSVNTFDSTRQPMHLLLYNWNTPWEDENMPNASTPDRLNVSVDWVRVWQKR